MKIFLENRFNKWEAKARRKTGDRAFLEKYIKSISCGDKCMRGGLPILLILNPINAIVYGLAQNFVPMGIWIFITVAWTAIAYVYYFFKFDFHKKKIEMWKQELAELNNKSQRA